eukprot:m.531087 g.531087  ORF g.531087 m.531087 type:complete len:1223 (-) comp57575_c0_seq2:122-3790(-)
MSYHWRANRSKWEGCFLHALKKVGKQANESVVFEDEVLNQLDHTLYCILAHICAATPAIPQTIEEAGQAVAAVLPEGLLNWAVPEAVAAVDAYIQSRRRTIKSEFPVEKVHSRLLKDVPHRDAVLYILTVLDYIAADVLVLASKYAQNCSTTSVLAIHLSIIIKADPMLNELFTKCADLPAVVHQAAFDLTYEDIKRELVLCEQQYMKRLDMLLRIFLEPLEGSPIISEKELSSIFGNLRDVHELCQNLLGALEDCFSVVEQRTDRANPQIGAVFEEFALDQEFDAVSSYVDETLNAFDSIMGLLLRWDVCQFFDAIDPLYAPAVQYELPQLVLAPLQQMLHYQELLHTLLLKTPDSDRTDRDLLRSALSALKAINLRKHPRIEKLSSYLLLPSFLAQREKTRLLALVERIEGTAELPSFKNQVNLLYEGPTTMLNEKTKKKADRQIFVCDGLVMFCKRDDEESAYRIKEFFTMEKPQVKFLNDTADMTNSIRVDFGEGSKVIISFPSAADRHKCAAALHSPTTSKFLDVMLERKQDEYEKEVLPFLLASIRSRYEFVEQDSDANIRFETKAKNLGPPVIKGATQNKLIERLTFPNYVDTNYLRQFLTTYRSFCSKEDLLRLLKLRYAIPDPDIGSDKYVLRSFNKIYRMPIRVRVLNVLKQWVEKHFYDFENNPKLLQSLLEFVRGTLLADGSHKKAVAGLTRVIKKNRGLDVGDGDEFSEGATDKGAQRTTTSDLANPLTDFLWLTESMSETYHVLNLNPIEVARQLTLIEYSIFAKIKPSELIGQPWMKADKETNAPNVLHFVHRFNNVSHWVVRTLVELQHHQERVECLSMFIEIMRELLQLNNFNGVMEIYSALDSSAIRRLKFTWAEIPAKRKKTFDECGQLMTREKNFSMFRAKLQSITPPCLPFFGMYLSDITFIEQGSPDWLPEDPDAETTTQQTSPKLSKLINFGKRRLVARSTNEIQQYQLDPYDLAVEPSIQQFLLELPSISTSPVALPVGSGPEAEKFQEEAFDLSVEIEPRSAADKTELKQCPRFFQDIKTQKARKDFLSGSGKSVRRSTASLSAELPRTLSVSSTVFDPFPPAASSVPQTPELPPPIVPRHSASVHASPRSPFPAPPHGDSADGPLPPPRPPRSSSTSSVPPYLSSPVPSTPTQMRAPPSVAPYASPALARSISESASPAAPAVPPKRTSSNSSDAPPPLPPRTARLASATTSTTDA